MEGGGRREKRREEGEGRGKGREGKRGESERKTVEEVGEGQGILATAILQGDVMCLIVKPVTKSAKHSTHIKGVQASGGVNTVHQYPVVPGHCCPFNAITNT